MHKKDVLRSPRLTALKKKRRIKVGKKISILGVFMALVFFGAGLVLKWEKINIQDIEISGNKVVELESIRGVVEESITGNYFYFIPKTSFLLYPKDAIEDNLRQKFKRIANLEVDVRNLQTLAINVTEREPKYTWCGVEEDREVCYFMDESGYIFSEAPYFSPEVYFRFYGGIQGSPVGAAFGEGQIARLVRFKEMLELLELSPQALRLGSGGDASIVLESDKDPEPEIKFSLNAELDTLIENLDSALSTPPLQTEFREKYSALEYIDLRFDNKVYYRFK